jgi:hypothetical protein
VQPQFVRDGLAAHLDFAFVLTGLCKIVTGLHPHPSVRGAAESLRKPDSYFSTNAGPAGNDF